MSEAATEPVRELRRRLLEIAESLETLVAQERDTARREAIKDARANPRWLTLKEAAAILEPPRVVITLRHWIAQGKLRGETGLVRVAGKPMVDERVFREAFIKRP